MTMFPAVLRPRRPRGRGRRPGGDVPRASSTSHGVVGVFVAPSLLLLLSAAVASLASRGVAAFAPPSLPPARPVASRASRVRRTPTRRSVPLPAGSSGALPTSPPLDQTLDEFLPEDEAHPLRPLLRATAAASEPKGVRVADRGADADDGSAGSAGGSTRPPEFRYEWGTWIDGDRLDEVRAHPDDAPWGPLCPMT